MFHCDIAVDGNWDGNEKTELKRLRIKRDNLTKALYIGFMATIISIRSLYYYLSLSTLSGLKVGFKVTVTIWVTYSPRNPPVYNW